MSDQPVDKSRRTWIAITCGAGAVGGVATAIPFVATFTPSEKARAAGAPVEVEIGDLAPGERMTVEWRGKPVWIMRRTEEQLATLNHTEVQVADPASLRTQYPTPEYARNQHRSIKPEIFVAGAQPSLPNDWQGGFLCPCHGSTFDLAGRVFRNKPAPDNLEVPPHMFLSDTRLLIGDDSQA